MAKSVLREVIDTLRPELDEGVAIIGLEPSCVSVFRDELPNLFPNDEAARRLSKSVMTFSEFIAREGDAFRLPLLHRKVLVQSHCHHKNIMSFGADLAVMKTMGLDVEHPDSGCCGMAGAFGFEAGEHYEVSMRVGERVLLPKVREAAADTLIIANGFSCREQIDQSTDRQALHLAQVLKMAMDEGPQGTPGDYPERKWIAAKADPKRGWWKLAGLVGGVALVVGGMALLRKSRARAKSRPRGRDLGGRGYAVVE